MSLGNTNSVFQLSQVQLHQHNKTNADTSYLFALLNAGWRWGNGSNTDGSQTQTIRYFFYSSNPSNPWDANDDTDPASSWTIERQIGFSLAMRQWENVANVRFDQVFSLSSADLVLINTTVATIGGFAGYAGTPNQARNSSATSATEYYKKTSSNVTFKVADAGQVGVFVAGRDLDDFGAAQSPNGWGPDSLAWTHIVHEIGHALGLKHPHDEGTVGWNPFPGVDSANDGGQGGLNTIMNTIMSYNKPKTTFKGLADSPMAFDIAAVQLLYGANATYNNGDDTYYLPDPTTSNKDSSYGEPGKQFESIWDTGGLDEVVYNGAADATIDLRPATLTGIDGAAGWFNYTKKGSLYGRGFSIAGDITNAIADQNGMTGVIIENASGGSGNDNIRGNDVNNVLRGNGGNDIIYGLMGDDHLYGGVGKDSLYGGIGDDSYYLQDVTGGKYDLALDNGSGHDTVYLDYLAGGPKKYTLTAFMEDGIMLSAVGDGFTLTGNSIDNRLQGTDFRETLSGAGGNDILNGLRGLDTLIGGAGDDIYILGHATDGVYDTVVEARRGGEDTVWVRRDPSSTATSYTLAAQVENGKILDELLDPTNGSFELIGNDLDNKLWGGVGGDILRGGAGNDQFFGNDDALNSGTDGDPHTPVLGRDTFYGGPGDDVYYLYELDVVDVNGSDYSFVVEEPNEGRDTVRVMAAWNGNHYVTRYDMTANVEVGVVDGTIGVWIIGNNLDNVLIGNTADDMLWGSDGNDKLFGMAGRDELRGGDGNDEYYLADVTQFQWDDVIESGIDGGIDTVYIQAAAAPIIIYRNDYELPDFVENGIVETGWDFLLTGNGLGNVLAGNAGADQLVGKAGSDVLLGFGGRDVLYGDGGGTSGFADIFRYTAVSDSAAGAATRDLIMDFEQGAEVGDKIDLSPIDTNTKVKGDQAFVFIGEAAFSSGGKKKLYGELRVDNSEGFSVLQADVTGDGIADFEIEFDRIINFTENDFIL